jgi:hypothetical protein
MPDQPRSERETQNRVVALFTDNTRPDWLSYGHLGKWDKRERNRPVAMEILCANLVERGYSSVHISAALERLQTAADTTGATLYHASGAQRRADVMHNWHKTLLHEVVPPLIQKWEQKLSGMESSVANYKIINLRLTYIGYLFVTRLTLGKFV